MSPIEQAQRFSLQTEISVPAAVGSGEEADRLTIIELPPLPPLLNLLNKYDVIWWKSFDDILYELVE